MKTFLHIGCGSKHKDKTTRGFNTPDWQEVRLDIDQNVSPDITGTMLDMSDVQDASMDKVLTATLQAHGFANVASMKRGSPGFDLWALAVKQPMVEEELKALAKAHFPVK
jgi:hypothetical protein